MRLMISSMGSSSISRSRTSTGSQDLPDQVGGRDRLRIEANAIGQFIHVLDLQALAPERRQTRGLLAVARHEFHLLGAQQPSA